MRGAVIPLNPLDIAETADAIAAALQAGERKRKSMARGAREVVQADASFK